MISESQWSPEFDFEYKKIERVTEYIQFLQSNQKVRRQDVYKNYILTYSFIRCQCIGDIARYLWWWVFLIIYQPISSFLNFYINPYGLRVWSITTPNQPMGVVRADQETNSAGQLHCKENENLRYTQPVQCSIIGRNLIAKEKLISSIELKCWWWIHFFNYQGHKHVKGNTTLTYDSYIELISALYHNKEWNKERT